MNLAINGGTPVSATPLRFDWPIINESVEQAIITQLHESISIYDDSGIFQEFENEFAEYHHMPYALLVNSGTSGLQSAYYSMMLQPGDEVICPVYTFHATVSPMMHFGLVPTMIDCDMYGQIDPALIEKAITDKTKAVIVTHMWGYAVDIEKVREICDRHGLLLIEDCSHAHGATVGGRPLGSFGDISIWSLQGQKIITGGEGGIMLFKDKKYLERAVLYGHYNKRCKQQVEDDSLKAYALTGAGLKLRASTLNVAMARHYFSQMDTINTEKSQNAARLNRDIALIDGMQILEPRPLSTNSWYAQNIMYDEIVVGVPRERFVAALHAEGLAEVDIPGSTGPLHREPLFSEPRVVFPYLYESSLHNNDRTFERAESFYSRIIKLPVWTATDNATDRYIEGFNKVVANIHELQ